MRKSEYGMRKGWEAGRLGCWEAWMLGGGEKAKGREGMIGIRKSECGMRPIGAGPTPRWEGGKNKD